MKIEVELTNAEVNHLKPTHDFYDACEIENQVMRKVQKAIVKGLKRRITSSRRIRPKCQ